MNPKLYFIDYDDTGEGCPSYTGGKFFKDNIWTGDHEWEFDDPNPGSYEIKSAYSLKIDEKWIDFDYAGETYVSENFLKALDECKVHYRAVPLEIYLRRNKQPEKKYFFLLLYDRFFLLDKEKSKYIVCQDPYNEEYLYEEYFPDEVCYDSIDEFYIKYPNDLPDFFICAELKKEICTKKFKKICESLNITGIKFTEIMDGFRHNPWED